MMQEIVHSLHIKGRLFGREFLMQETKQWQTTRMELA